MQTTQLLCALLTLLLAAPAAQSCHFAGQRRAAKVWGKQAAVLVQSGVTSAAIIWCRWASASCRCPSQQQLYPSRVSSAAAGHLQ